MSDAAVESDISIENVVVSSGINHELDLQQLSLDLSGSDYDPDNFPGLIYRTQDPKATTLIFRSGKLVATGAKSVDAAETVVNAVVQKLSDLGIPTNDPPITVQNIVSSGTLGQSLNLNAIAIGLGLENVEYEPEQFPGLVYRLDDPEVVVLMFGSGKCVITGATRSAEAARALELVKDDLSSLGLL